MMIQSVQRDDAPIIKFPTLAERTGLLNPEEPLTLRGYYERILLPDFLADIEAGDDAALAKRSLDEDKAALRNWERYTDNKPLHDLSAEDLQSLKAGMLQRGLSPHTIAKTWRELAAIMRYAVQDGFLDTVPRLTRQSGRLRKQTGIIAVKKPRQRQLVTLDEAASLWRACRHATYPADCPPGLPAPKTWRVALLLFWLYGPRTMDVLQLRWSDVRFGDKLIQFESQKTGKLQGLPMTDLVAEHLRSIRTQYNRDRVFYGFNTVGHYNSRRRWKPGWRSTWRREICEHAELTEPVLFKNFRQRVVSEYNASFPSIKLGSWIAGHSLPGVSAQNYELPTREIRAAIESAPIPDCFREIG